MNPSANQIPPEVWVSTLALTRRLSSLVPSSTKFLSRLFQSTPLLDKYWRMSFACDLLSSVQASALDESEDAQFTEGDIIHFEGDFNSPGVYKLHFGNVNLSPHAAFTRTSNDSNESNDHPLQAILRATSSPANQTNPQCSQVYQFLIHAATLKWLLGRSRHGKATTVQIKQSLPAFIEQSLHRQKEWPTELALHRVLLACIYASHFIVTGDLARLDQTLDHLICMIRGHQAILTSMQHAASPLRWSLVVADSLQLKNAARKLCQMASIGNYAKDMDNFFGFGQSFAPETDGEFRMTFAEYLVWLALVYWRIDVAQYLVDRFKINMNEVMGRTFNLPQLANMSLELLPYLTLLGDHAQALDRRVKRQLEWMTGHGWQLVQVVSPTTVFRANQVIIVVCKRLPVTSKASYPLFLELFHLFDEQHIAANKSGIAIALDDGFCAKVAAYLDLDPSFVDLVPFIIEHSDLVYNEDELASLLQALLRGKHVRFASELLQKSSKPEELLSKALARLFSGSTCRISDMVESIVSLEWVSGKRSAS